MSEIGFFFLLDDDIAFIDIALATARKLLRIIVKKKDKVINLTQIIGFKNAIRGLEMIPEGPYGVHCLFGLLLDGEAPSSKEQGYIRFIIKEDRFGVSIGNGGSYESFIKDTDPVYKRIKISSGYRETKCDLDIIEDLVDEYLSLGVEIVVKDKSWKISKDGSIVIIPICDDYDWNI